MTDCSFNSACVRWSVVTFDLQRLRWVHTAVFVHFRAIRTTQRCGLSCVWTDSRWPGWMFTLSLYIYYFIHLDYFLRLKHLEMINWTVCFALNGKKYLGVFPACVLFSDEFFSPPVFEVQSASKWHEHIMWLWRSADQQAASSSLFRTVWTQIYSPQSKSYQSSLVYVSLKQKY